MYGTSLLNIILFCLIDDITFLVSQTFVFIKVLNIVAGSIFFFSLTQIFFCISNIRVVPVFALVHNFYCFCNVRVAFIKNYAAHFTKTVYKTWSTWWIWYVHTNPEEKIRIIFLKLLIQRTSLQFYLKQQNILAIIYQKCPWNWFKLLLN